MQPANVGDRQQISLSALRANQKQKKQQQQLKQNENNDVANGRATIIAKDSPNAYPFARAQHPSLRPLQLSHFILRLYGIFCYSIKQTACSLQSKLQQQTCW